MKADELNINQPVILFDGLCNLCSTSVQFIIKRDKKNIFKFASLQSELGQSILSQVNLSTSELNSFIFYKAGRVYTQSTGALLVTKELSGAWPLLSVLMIVPPFIRNGVYNIISKNRYKWFGKKNECWLPTPALRDKFLDN